MQISVDDLRPVAAGGDNLHLGVGQVHPVSVPSAAEPRDEEQPDQTDPVRLQERGHAEASMRTLAAWKK